MNIDDFKRTLIQSGVAKDDSIIGLTEDELKDVELSCSVKLPSIYKNFLRVCGKKAGYLGRTLGLFYPTIKTLKEDLISVIDEEDIGVELPENAFVFSSYEGLVFDYFICEDVDDPYIFRIDEGKQGIESRGLTFTDYFFRLINTCDFSEHQGTMSYYWDGEKVVVTRIK